MPHRSSLAVVLLLGASAGTAQAAIAHRWTSSDHRVSLSYPAGVTPHRDLPGAALMTAGWRLIWDGSAQGPGRAIVGVAIPARPAEGIGQVTESLRIGASSDKAVVATCGTSGLKGGSTTRLPNRMIGGHRWTAWRNGDAGMSQQISATDLRTVIGGTCYAVERVSYAVKAANAPPRGTPSQTAAAAQVDAILASLRIAR